MLDQDLKDQLRTVFAPLEKEITLVYQPSVHTDQSSLIDMADRIDGGEWADQAKTSEWGRRKKYAPSVSY